MGLQLEIAENLSLLHVDVNVRQSQGICARDEASTITMN